MHGTGHPALWPVCSPDSTLLSGSLATRTVDRLSLRVVTPAKPCENHELSFSYGGTRVRARPAGVDQQNEAGQVVGWPLRRPISPAGPLLLVPL
jgi:hypothetical protein